MSEKLEIAHDMVYKNSRLLNIGEGHVERLKSPENICSFPVLIIKLKKYQIGWRFFDLCELRMIGVP